VTVVAFLAGPRSLGDDRDATLSSVGPVLA
jgi:hypothetical protein